MGSGEWGMGSGDRSKTLFHIPHSPLPTPHYRSSLNDEHLMASLRDFEGRRRAGRGAAEHLVVYGDCDLPSFCGRDHDASALFRIDHETDCAVVALIGSQPDWRFAFDFGLAVATDGSLLRPCNHVELRSGDVEAFQPGLFGSGDAAE